MRKIPKKKYLFSSEPKKTRQQESKTDEELCEKYLKEIKRYEDIILEMKTANDPNLHNKEEMVHIRCHVSWAGFFVKSVGDEMIKIEDPLFFKDYLINNDSTFAQGKDLATLIFAIKEIYGFRFVSGDGQCYRDRNRYGSDYELYFIKNPKSPQKLIRRDNTNRTELCRDGTHCIPINIPIRTDLQFVPFEIFTIYEYIE